MKRIVFFISLALCFCGASYAQKAPKKNARAKYVFYFIGDGMGVNQVNGAETYLAAREGRIGTSPLLFPSFPYVGLITTQSATNGVTDSAAAGTALASGVKTKNHAVGVLKDLQTPVPTIAEKAKQHGAAVGITTSVSVDHATPAVFYAHVPKRTMYYEIGKQLPASGFDFFAGSDFLQPTSDKDSTTTLNLYQQAEAAGYQIVHGYPQFLEQYKQAQRMILLQPEKSNAEYNQCIPYVVDQQPGDLKLQDITRAAITFLEKQKKDGFFLMIEGGMIDYACHRNDIGNAINEVLDMDKAVKVAYEFYQQHPDETIIVITADHETGGLVMGTGPYELHTDILKYQRKSIDELTWILQQQYKKAPKKFTWEAVQKQLKELMGFGAGIELKDKEAERLQERWAKIEKAIADNEEKVGDRIKDLCQTVKHILSEKAMISWASGGHSNGYVPVYAIGPGTEVFQGRIDNIEIAPAMAKIAGYEAE